MELWSQLKTALKNRVSAQVYAAWIAQIRPKSLRENCLLLALPDRFAVDWVQDHYRHVIEGCLQDLAPEVYIRFVVEDPDTLPFPQNQSTFSPRTEFSSPASNASEMDPKQTGAPNAQRPQPQPSPQEQPLRNAPSSFPPALTPPTRAASEPELQLNDKYTFDSFVVGDSNKLAAAAAKSVAENPGAAYNPLFVFGRVGLGKTHLIQAIANTIRWRQPEAHVRYQTTEKFVNDVVQGIRFEKMNDLRATYRACDVLLIDDIQFIAGKEACQAEFFHTFNALHQAGKQVVVTSDKLPHEIPDLEERVKSRFIWGLIVDLQPPELETRVAIVKKKADLDGIPLDNEVAMFIAQSVRSNVRELEGCLIRASAYAQLSGQPLTVELAKSVLRDVLPGKGQLTLDAIIKAVCKHFDLKVADLKGSKRSRAIAQPRQIAMHLCRKHTSASYPEIGKAFGGKDHTTALNAYNRIRDRLEEEQDLRRQVEIIEGNLIE